ncbi:MAG: hypothetical protein V2I43_17575 [Parvularcula sp.]|jgi:hypothetical protein|nr:hypothetical protein [Parvularcula sp.]
MSAIVVTGQRADFSPTFHPYFMDFDFASAGFGAYFFLGSGTTLQSSLAQGERDFTIPEDPDGDAPKTEVKNVDADELGVILGTLDKAEANTALNDSFKEMAAKDVTLEIVVLPNKPSGRPSGEIARVEITAVQNADGSQSFAANSTTTIFVYANKLDNRDNTFEKVLAHELAHITRGSDGKFLKNDNGTHRSNERDIYRDVIKDIDPDNYTNSLDQLDQSISGNQITVWGTDGNNLIETEPMTSTVNGTSFLSYNDVVYTGDGNDIVVTGQGNDVIVVDGTGLKLIADFDFGYDVVTLSQITSMPEVKMTKVGFDAYLTHTSVANPVDDPNAVVLTDFYRAPLNNVEFVKTANGDLKALNGFDTNPTIPGSFSTTASVGDGALPGNVDDLIVSYQDLLEEFENTALAAQTGGPNEAPISETSQLNPSDQSSMVTDFQSDYFVV